uniref:Transmembrane protein 18 n=1 Tax=Megaselia scalaris TaxID=36166 RepID=T1H6D5_MEGSC
MEPIEITEITGYWAFLRNIDWRDPWLIAMIFFHVVTTCTALLTRNRINFQVILFLTLLSFAYFSESINEYAAQNWKMFSKQQYFDSNGLFISTVFSMPILLNCMLLIGAWLYNSTQMMAQLKSAQMRQRSRKEHQERQ